MENGQIQIQVFTSRGKIPVPDASILIRQGREIFALDVSNASGWGRQIQIPVKGEKDPQGVSPPYTLVEILVEHPNFISQNIGNVKVFPGTESLLPVELIPLAEDESSLVETTVNDLEGGGPWQ